MLAAGDTTQLVDWVSRGGLLAGALVAVWAFLSGRVHSDSEFQREVKRGDESDEKLDRILNVQEDLTALVKESIDKRAEIKSLDDLAKLADIAREQGLIK